MDTVIILPSVTKLKLRMRLFKQQPLSFVYLRLLDCLSSLLGSQALSSSPFQGDDVYTLITSNYAQLNIYHEAYEKSYDI